MARKIKSEKLTTNYYELVGKADVYKIRRELAKSANQRMLRLERSVSPISGEHYTFGAYDIAHDYIKSTGKNRFSEAVQKNRDIYDVLNEISVLQAFLNSESSTIKGMHDIENRRVKTFESKGISFANTKEFYDFLNSASFTYLSTHGFNSEDIIDLYQRSAEDGVDLNAIQKALDDFRDTPGRKSYKELVQKFDAKALKNSKN